MDTSDALVETLQSRFQMASFRQGQREVLTSLSQKQDTLAVMPTGGGKSLCYQLPALLQQGIVVVISPLIALMEDQVRALERLGIPAGFVHSGQTIEDKRKLFGQLKTAEHFILYLSPERVQKEGFGEWVRNQRISLFAVDESHCVSQWGPDFRRDYYKLSLLRELRPDVPILALTATATPMVLKDIVKQLGLRNPARHIYGFYRPNLYVQVEQCESEGAKLQLLRSALRHTPQGRILIYCGTRKQTEAVCENLQSEFPSIGFYHAGLNAEERLSVQMGYQEGEIRILAATNAFGMGIDHPDVRLVVHFQMPANIESYYQEIGRAGRDGKDSTCLLLYSKKDKGLHSYFITQSESDAATAKRRWRALDNIVQYAEGGECRHSGILTYFRDTFRLKACGHCDICQTDSPRRILEPVIAYPEKEKVISKKKRSDKWAASGPLTPEETLRVEVLKAWRKEYAEEHDIPAFIVFSNKTLEDLARKNPSTEEELSEVYGFGPQKTLLLGPFILEKLAHCGF